MMLKVATLSALVVAVAVGEPVHDAKRIAVHVNVQGSTWTASGDTRFHGQPLSRVNRLMGAWASPNPPKSNPDFVPTMAIPASFDARLKWPMCADVIGNIRDQSECGSCWAVAAASAMSDRLCIASQGKTKVSISAANLMECCSGMFGCGNGCDGGFPDKAWEYFKKTGIVTGSNYTAKQGCQPYPFPPCEHHIKGPTYGPCPSKLYDTPKCSRSCQNGFPGQYEADKHHGGLVKRLTNVQEIQQEIMTGGPMEVAFNVYEDFLTYKSGVYQHLTGSYDGGHAVRVLGWGEENGVDYWLMANSWNADWGDKGYFKIRRGNNECGIENDVVASKMQ